MSIPPPPDPVVPEAEAASRPVPRLQLRPIQIGTLTVQWPVFLAPMAGYTDAAFRSLCIEKGCGGTVTEMVNAYGLNIGHKRTAAYLETWPGESPLCGAQIYGSDPGVMAAAAKKIADSGAFAFVDINAGCPVPKIRSRGDGAGLMKNPKLMAEIVRQVVAAVDGKLPVTLKTRIGWDEDHLDAVDTTAAVEEAGASAIFLHARTTVARHSGPAAWEHLAAVKAARRIPVIGNGGLKTPADVARMVADTGVDGVMIGRAALGNPWIFSSIRHYAETGELPPPPGAAEIRSVIVAHLERERQLMSRRGKKELKLGEELTAVLVLRAHIISYLRGFSGIKTLAQTLEERIDGETLLQRVDAVLATPPRRLGPPTPPPASATP